MIWLTRIGDWINAELIRLSADVAPARRIVRTGVRWWQWLTQPNLRSRLARVGWHLVPIIRGAAPEGIPGYLRIRVVNRSPLFWFTDGFENTAGMTTTWFNSIGTGTDQSITYWTQVTGSWSIASNLVTTTAAAGILTAGHADWTDMTFRVRFKWATGNTMAAMLHYTDANNWIGAIYNGPTTTFSLIKKVGGVETLVSSAADTLVNGTFYWMDCVASGTTYNALLYNDSAGSIGTARQNKSGTIADAALQQGIVGLNNRTAVVSTWGGAFANVCIVTGTGPDGTQGQAWTPFVTAGDPAFAWSKVSPQAGTYSASIYNANAAGNGAWRQQIRLFSGSNVTLSAQAKASAGTANVSAGGLTTSNAGTSFGAVTGVGAITANPTVSCNYSGAVGTAYFDTLSITNPAYEITNDLPHLHQTEIEVRAMQPGNPGSNALGSFTVRLHPPGSDGYAAAKAIYDQLIRFLRVEMYISHDGASLGELYYAGIITGIRKNYGTNSAYELTGASDIVLLNLSKPWPGDTMTGAFEQSSGVNYSDAQARTYFGTNELGVADDFSAYTPSSYLSTTVNGGTAGNWVAATDAGAAVLSCSSGTGAALLSKTGVSAPGTAIHQQYAEVTVRLATTSSDAANAGTVGIGLSVSNNNTTTNHLVVARTKKNASTNQWDLDALVYQNGSLIATSTGFLTNVNSTAGIPLTIGIGDYVGLSQGVFYSINGSINPIISAASALSSSPVTIYPFLCFIAPASGAATAYFSNLTQLYRYTDDQVPGQAAFKKGSFDTPNFSLPVLTTANPAAARLDPSFLEIISRTLALEGWFGRYTPQPFVIGSRLLGTIDMAADPGTDLASASSVRFSRPDGNLLALEFNDNSDQFTTNTTATSSPATDGGGVAYFRNVSSMVTYGVLDSQALTLSPPNFGELLRTASRVSANRTSVDSSGAKTAVILREPQTLDKWREVDKVGFHDPEIGINYLSSRVLGYTFTEGSTEQTLTLDQFTADDPTLSLKRLQTAVWMVAQKFANR